LKKSCYILIIICLNLFWVELYAQDTAYVRNVVNELSSDTYFGRGYLNNGLQKTADFLESEMQSIGLLPFADSYRQGFSYPQIIYPGDYSFWVDDQELTPSSDYIINPACGNLDAELELIYLSPEILNDSVLLCEYSLSLDRNVCPVIFLDTIKNTKQKSFVRSLVNANFLDVAAYILVEKANPVWSISSVIDNFAIVNVKSSCFPETTQKIRLKVEAKHRIVKTANLIGYLPGEIDKTIVFTAHYDHLGGIGDTLFFPGAHDNASGVAACLDIAKYYSKNTPNFRVVIMLFSGEEAGLLGSGFYTLFPLFPLDEIDFLINMDMVGTGEEGITIVNAKDSTYHEEWQLFEIIKRDANLSMEMKARDISANSDHFPFNLMGVKGVFIYSQGGNTFYHHILDKSNTISLFAYPELFQLITLFADSYDR
jgi:aminopeptidase YwaD